MQSMNVIFDLSPQAQLALAGRCLPNLTLPTTSIEHLPMVGDGVMFDDVAGAPIYVVATRLFVWLPDGRRQLNVVLDCAGNLDALVDVAQPQELSDG